MTEIIKKGTTRWYRYVRWASSNGFHDFYDEELQEAYVDLVEPSPGETPCYKFWDSNSGLLGEIIGGVVLASVIVATVIVASNLGVLYER